VTRNRAYILLLTAAGAALRVAGLDQQPLWLDEATDAAFAQRSFWNCVFAESVHPPLYRLLLHGSVSLIGNSEFALRLLPAFFGILAIPLTALLARKLHPPSEIFAGLLAATSPFLIYFSQENRNYSLLILLTLAATLVFLRLQETARGLPLYCALSVLLLYTHYLAVFVLLAHEALYWIYSRRNLKSWILGRAILLAAYAPWLVWVIGHYRAESRLFIPLFMFVPEALLRFFAGFGVVVYDSTELTPSIRRIAGEIIAVFPALIVFAWLLWKGGTVVLRNAKAAALFVAIILLPWVILHAAAPWVQLASVRYVSFQAPFLLILAAIGLSSLAIRERTITGGFLAIFICFFLIAYYGAPGKFLGYEFRYAKEDWRNAAAFVRMHSPDAVIVSPGYLTLALNRYPIGTKDTVEVTDDYEALRQLEGESQRMAVVTARMGPAQQALLKNLDSTYSRIAEASFTSQNVIYVVIYRGPHPANSQ
jgi:mannosyltransferase